MSGAVLSMIIMIILKKIQFFSSVGVSVAGGVLHNIGQIIAAVFIMGKRCDSILSSCTYDNRNSDWSSNRNCISYGGETH